MASLEGKQPSYLPDDEKHDLYCALEKLDQERRRKKRPSVINLITLCALFLSAGAGIALAVLQFIHPVEMEASCIARDLILFASAMALLYIGVHIRGAFTNYHRVYTGPPQIYGNYLHASALLIARLTIGVWLAALIATIIMFSKAISLEGFTGKLPFLNIVVCAGAIPPNIVILFTIEKNATPFVTTGLTRSSILTCRVSAFEEDLAADMSVSRRASLQREQRRTSFDSSSNTLVSKKVKETQKKPIHLVVSREINPNGEDAKTELMAGSPTRATHVIPRMPVSQRNASTSPPKRTYNSGGWRHEWNNVTNQVDVPTLTDFSSGSVSSTGSSSMNSSSFYSSQHSSNTTISSRAESPWSMHSTENKTVTPTSSISNSTRRSGLANVIFAEKPNQVVQTNVKLFRSPTKHAQKLSVFSNTSIPEHEAVSEIRPLPAPPPTHLTKPAKIASRTRERSLPASTTRSSSHKRNLSDGALQKQRPVSTGYLGTINLGGKGVRRNSHKTKPVRPGHVRRPSSPTPSRYRHRRVVADVNSSNTGALEVQQMKSAWSG